MTSRSGAFAACRTKIAVSALAAAVGIGLAAVPAAVGASVSSAVSPAAKDTAAKDTAANVATASQPRSAQAALAKLKQRARMAAEARSVRAATKTGSIAGTVLGANHQPIPGACVTAVGAAAVVTATAASNGTFTLSGLAPGSYALQYRDCAAAGKYFPAWSGGVAWRSVAAHVQVTAYQTRHVPVMTLKPTHTETAQAAAARFQQALTAASGRGLSATAAAKTGRISGRVTGNGKPLLGICVVAFPINGGQGYGATTDANGRYAVRFMRPGRYFVQFAGFGCPGQGNWLAQTYGGGSNPFGQGGIPVPVTAGQATRGINASLLRGGQISGTVTSRSGRKLGGICVNANGIVAGGSVGMQIATAPNGTYVLHALFPGKYFLQFTIGCGSTGNYAPGSHKPVMISYGTTVKGVNAVLSHGASITGRVTLGSSSGQGLAGMCVFASNADGSVQMAAATGPHGYYRVIGLTGDTYQLQIGPGCNNNGNYTTVLLAAKTTAGLQTSGVDAVLQVGATISGTVTDRKGRHVSNVCIELDGSIGPNEGFGFFGEAIASDGTYVVNQLPAGTYEIGFFGSCGNAASYAPWWYDNQSDLSLATPIVLATGASTTVNPRLQPGAGIAGTVTDASGHALPGICVFVATAGQAQLGPVFTEAAQTGTLGRYTLSGLAPGQYLVNFGCGLNARYADQWFHGAADSGSAELVSAPIGRTSGIDAVLRPGGSITGVVTGRSGSPLAGVCAEAVNTKDPNTVLGGGIGDMSFTNAHGVYRISGLAAGAYDVLFQPCSGPSPYAEQWYRQQGALSIMTAVRVRSGKLTSGISGRLPIGGSISGRVVNGSATPLRNICVIAFDFTTDYAGFGATGRSGTYTIAPLPTGSYTIEFFPCGNQNLITVLSSAKVAAPHAVTGVNATLLPGGSISGLVTAAAGGPVSDVCVEVLSSDPSNPGGFGGTAPDGSYVATGLAAGTYQVLFDPTCLFSSNGLVPQWYNDKPTQATADPVTVTVGNTTPSINAALERGGRITGTVSGPGNVPLKGICVTAAPISAGPSSTGLSFSAPVVAVSRTGAYTLVDLAPGQYTVEFSSGCGATGYQRQWWQGASSAAAATPVAVGIGQVVSGISATLSN